MVNISLHNRSEAKPGNMYIFKIGLTSSVNAPPLFRAMLTDVTQNFQQAGTHDFQNMSVTCLCTFHGTLEKSWGRALGQDRKRREVDGKTKRKRERFFGAT
uniref:Longin domain-containing protein n=1 Tax=Globodera pallida TaxID=36090 RepID=A0A183CKM7_GLOPA